ncbi:helix-turn-helix transcriptional regulator [Rhodoplanes sp. Z2-YC6860]|uniref:helix-turn-helix transcriptional regulator n=1 Tax=Rhodoplanes sp. Z2-YC6860 TaxID=674703 RepID=UPI00078E15B1|nr:helix-turn-helix transcriptional regulator [Rhodoplanes sp. Z2-YC6860]AMN44494.1 anaerobic benzoate catabolism transcriptional regulator [Rhodoplanes sp. Z2-YC6860]
MASTFEARDIADASSRADAAFAAEIGRMVRLGRAKRGLSRRLLAQASGTSERYLAQIESGAGNPSVLVLRAIADALEMPMFELLPQTGGVAAPYARIIDLLGRVPPSDLAVVADSIERQIAHIAAADRGRRIGLVGLRGAGKSTLGKLLAEKLGVPFIELNRKVEQEYGATVPLLIEMSGIATFRRYERACLERAIAENESAVIATAGGIVSNPETYGLLLRRTHTVWISAQPEEHMGRVMKQGDFRPMAKNREAMADLHSILESRRADYARAELNLDTSGATIQQSFAKLSKLVAPWMKG